MLVDEHGLRNEEAAMWEIVKERKSSVDKKTKRALTESREDERAAGNNEESGQRQHG